MTDTAHLGTTRAGYDAIAESYAEMFRTALDDDPLDRALLAAFAELVGRAHPDREVLEVGSGPGHVTAHLHRLGTAVRGIDLSPVMVEIARREHPEVGFEVGEMGALDAASTTLAGVVACTPSSTCPQGFLLARKPRSVRPSRPARTSHPRRPSTVRRIFYGR